MIIDLQRAGEFRARVYGAGLTWAELARRASISRNVMYRLSRGGKPSPDQQQSINRVLREATVESDRPESVK